MSRPRRLIFKLAGALAVWFAAPLFAEENAGGNLLDAIQQRVREVYEKSAGAVVRIEATDAFGRLAGTGFFIDPNGTLYTAYSIGGESQDITVHFRGAALPATRLFSDARSGIALLKIDATTPFLTCAAGHDLALAAPVIALGYPMALPLTPAFGIVGGFDVKYAGRYFATTHIRASVPVQRGEGGAPLLNTRGEVVGILISLLDAGAASFVLPIEAAEKVRMDFTRFRQARPGWIGISVQAADAPADGSTARIEEVLAGAPGEKAGLRAGDILLQIGARPIHSPEDVLDASFFLTAADAVTVRIARAGTAQKVFLQPTDPPDARPRPQAANDPAATQQPAALTFGP